MRHSIRSRRHGFTLLETVIAIGVLAVLLSGFVVVFAPAAEGIRKSINSQQADRLASALEQELVTLREGEKGGDINTGFDKAFDRIRKSTNAADALFVYQYRAQVNGAPRTDGSPNPQPVLTGKLPGKDYIVVPMMRKKGDAKFNEDLEAIEGPVYLVKCTQLIFENGQLVPNKDKNIKDPKTPTTAYTDPAEYPEAVIAFSADFHIMPAKTPAYFSGPAFDTKFTNVKNPVFTRNLAVRR